MYWRLNYVIVTFQHSIYMKIPQDSIIATRTYGFTAISINLNKLSKGNKLIDIART